MIRASGCGIYTGQFGHGESRGAHEEENDEHPVYNRNTTSLLHTNDHGGRQAHPTVADVESHTENCKGSQILLHLRLKAESFENQHVADMALLNYQQVNTPIGSVNPLEYSPLWPMGEHVRLVI